MHTQHRRHSPRQIFLFWLAMLWAPLTLAAPYELRVYSDDIPNKGESDIEILMSVARPNASNNALSGRVFQTLVELGYGLGHGWTVGLEMPMSQTQGQANLNGLKAEVQYVSEVPALQGMYWGFRSDVGYIASPYQEGGERSIDVNPILGFRAAGWHVVVNPSFEIPLSGSHRQTQFQPSAKVATATSHNSQLGIEYFSLWGAWSSWLPKRQRDEMLYWVWDKKMSHSRWNVGVGRPLTTSVGNADAWVVKVGVSLDVD